MIDYRRSAPLREGIDIPEVSEADRARGRFHNHVRMCGRCHIAVCGRMPNAKLLCDAGLAQWTSAVWWTFEEVGLPHVGMR